MTNKEFITTWFANIDANKFDALQNMMDKNHKFNNPMTPAPIGTDEHLGMMKMMTGSFNGGHTLDVVIAEGEWVSARGHWSGTHSGEFNGIPATGKPVTFSFIDVMRIVNGKVVEEYFEMNPMSIMAQIGATPAA